MHMNHYAATGHVVKFSYYIFDLLTCHGAHAGHTSIHWRIFSLTPSTQREDFTSVFPLESDLKQWGDFTPRSLFYKRGHFIIMDYSKR